MVALLPWLCCCCCCCCCFGGLPAGTPVRHSFNAALDPVALQRVLGSGVELVLVGSSCYARPAWVEELFGEEGGERGKRAGGFDGEAATALRTLGGLDPYSMCYDPLALLFHLQPDAFAPAPTPTAVRVSGDVGTADGWRFERCAPAEAQGHVLEPSTVDRERYATFLRQACCLE